MWKNGRLVDFNYEYKEYTGLTHRVKPILVEEEIDIVSEICKRIKGNTYCDHCHSFTKCRWRNNQKVCLRCFIGNSNVKTLK